MNCDFQQSQKIKKIRLRKGPELLQVYFLQLLKMDYTSGGSFLCLNCRFCCTWSIIQIYFITSCYQNLQIQKLLFVPPFFFPKMLRGSFLWEIKGSRGFNFYILRIMILITTKRWLLRQNLYVNYGTLKKWCLGKNLL